jgi:hypothetical protein
MEPPLKVMLPVACSRIFVWPAKSENEVMIRSSPKTVDDPVVIKATAQIRILTVRFIFFKIREYA